MHEIGDVIVKLNEEGITVLLVEQKLPFARRVARTFCIMDRGRTVANGEIADLNDDIVPPALDRVTTAPVYVCARLRFRASTGADSDAPSRRAR